MGKPPFSYYGGKQRIARHIVAHIPRHIVYVEPFAGAATILFAKKTPSVTNKGHYIEVVNDKNECIYNFFRVLQNRNTAKELYRILRYMPTHEKIHKESKKCEEEPEEILRAAKWFANIQMSFSHIANSGYRYALRGDNIPYGLTNLIKSLPRYINRIRNVQFFNRDALSIIKAFDAPQTFFYIDPPYINRNQGHYSGYTESDYLSLLDILKNVRGSFILSGYSTGLEPDIWKRVDIEAVSSAMNSKKFGKKSPRIESIWIVDNGGGIEENRFRRIYETDAFQEIWPLEKANDPGIVDKQDGDNLFPRNGTQRNK